MRVRAISCSAKTTPVFGKIGDRIDAARIEPFARDGGGNVDFLLVIGFEDLDRLAENFCAEIRDRHLGRDHRAAPADIGNDAALIAEDADDDLVGRRLREHGQRSTDDERKQSRDERSPHELSFHVNDLVRVCRVEMTVAAVWAGANSASGEPSSSPAGSSRKFENGRRDIDEAARAAEARPVRRRCR